jgi:hypothetical protein
MEAELYYTPPADELFEEVKKASINVWNDYDDTHGYATEKIKRIKDIGNVGDNFMYMVSMFDMHNQRKLSSYLSEESKKAVKERLLNGGMEPQYIVF